MTTDGIAPVDPGISQSAMGDHRQGIIGKSAEEHENGYYYWISMDLDEHRNVTKVNRLGHPDASFFNIFVTIIS